MPDQAKRRPGRPVTTGTTPTRSMRIGEVYDQAKAKAETHGENITAVVERLLRQYVEGH